MSTCYLELIVTTNRMFAVPTHLFYISFAPFNFHRPLCLLLLFFKSRDSRKNVKWKDDLTFV